MTRRGEGTKVFGFASDPTGSLTVGPPSPIRSGLPERFLVFEN